MAFPYMAAAYGVSSVADMIAQLLGGNAAAKQQKKLFGIGEDLYNTPEGEYTKDVSKDSGLAMEALGPTLQTDANRIGKRLGLDSGAAQAEIAQNNYSTNAQIVAQMIADAKRRRQADRLAALQVMGSAV